MDAQDQTTPIAAIGHVELRVRDLRRSVSFYCDVFGLRCQALTNGNDRQRVCVGLPASGRAPFGVVLSEGFPAGAELAGLDHVGMSVACPHDVRELYEKARGLGYRATQPRVFNGRFQVFLFDPDGYKLEVSAEQSQ